MVEESHGMWEMLIIEAARSAELRKRIKNIVYQSPVGV